MTTSTISLVHIATTSATVVPNSFPINVQVILLHHKTFYPMLAQGPTLVRLIRPRCGHRKEPLPVRAPLPQELEAQAARCVMKRREFCSASRCVASKGVLLSSTSTPVHLMSGHSGGWKLEQLAASVEYPSAGVPQLEGRRRTSTTKRSFPPHPQRRRRRRRRDPLASFTKATFVIPSRNAFHVAKIRILSVHNGGGPCSQHPTSVVPGTLYHWRSRDCFSLLDTQDRNQRTAGIA
ncbi:hypothetical protein BKA70DRAFT_369240 [Coprinopsis sp. MPI-PUGE-AT-0042]|nr:hypothetical protein BKA70DRAFT_369240 [Coprinopsis sp. MPI-PUGE-AT-0042]